MFTKPIKVKIHSAVAGAKIHYTLDGSEPSRSSRRHDGPIPLAQTTRVKAKAFKAGMAPSFTVSAAYVFK